MTISAKPTGPHRQLRTKRALAIISTWPDTKNAEFEVIERLVAAAANIGADVFVIDDDGYVLSSTAPVSVPAGHRVTQEDCDFAISLHFQSPRSVDIYSYVTLWNPPEYLHVFGYDPSVEQMASHNDVLSCHSDMADAHAVNLFAGFDRPLRTPLQPLFHSLPGPYLAPNINAESKLFYIGINWEKISGTKGRHHYLLEQLDEENLINIYGPREFYGVKPWEGFKNYVDEIPFDGRSVLKEVNASGICLAFSSAAHQQSGIMSNRLFEGLAAGAAVIANPHPFIDKYFSDCVYVVDDTLPPEEVYREVVGILNGIRSNPAEALERAHQGQQRLAERFSLEICLTSLFDNHGHRAQPRVRAGATISVVLVYNGSDTAIFADMVANARRQTGVTLHLHVLVTAAFQAAFQHEIDRLCRAEAGDPQLASCEISILPSGPRETRGRLVNSVLRKISADYLCIMECDEIWFSDHLAKLVEAIDRSPDAYIAASGRIREDAVSDTRLRRRFETLGFKGEGQLIEAAHGEDSGRFLFRSQTLALVPDVVLPLLDGCEVRALGLWAMLSGPLALSNVASLVLRQDIAADRAPSVLPEDQQVEFIRDSVRGNDRWQRRRVDLSPDGRASDYRLPRIELNRVYRTQRHGEGLPFLKQGFSKPDPAFVWIDGLMGEIAFEMTANERKRELVLVIGGRDTGGEAGAQSCTVSVNGREVTSATFTEDATEVTVPLYPVAGPNAVKTRITIRLNRAEQVRNAEGKVLDPRYLGMRLISMTVLDRPTPAIDIGKIYEFRRDGKGIGLLRSGFSQPESNGVWMDGKIAHLAFTVAALPPDHCLALVVGSRRSKAGAAQGCRVRVNAIEVLRATDLAETRVELRVPLVTEVEGQREFNIHIEVDHAEDVENEAGDVVDARHLGLYLFRAQILAPPSDEHLETAEGSGSEAQGDVAAFPSSAGDRTGGPTAPVAAEKPLRTLSAKHMLIRMLLPVARPIVRRLRAWLRS